MKVIVKKGDLGGVVGFGPGKAARLERAGRFPRRRQIGPGQVGWLMSEIEAWAKELPFSDGTLRGEKPKAAA